MKKQQGVLSKQSRISLVKTSNIRYTITKPAKMKAVAWQPFSESRRLVGAGNGTGRSTFGAAGEEPAGRARYSAVKAAGFRQNGWHRGNELPSHKRDGAFCFIWKKQQNTERGLFKCSI